MVYKGWLWVLTSSEALVFLSLLWALMLLHRIHSQAGSGPSSWWQDGCQQLLSLSISVMESSFTQPAIQKFTGLCLTWWFGPHTHPWTDLHCSDVWIMLTVILGQMFLPGLRNEDSPKQEKLTRMECGGKGRGRRGGEWGRSNSSKESQGKEEGMNTRKARNGSCSTFKPKPLKDIFTVTKL